MGTIKSFVKTSISCQGCWCLIAHTFLSQLPEALQVIFGPIKIPFICHLLLFTKNIISIQYMSLLMAISLAKYMFIFIHKNYSGRFEDFWCFFTNAATLILSLIFQFAIQFLPGRKSYLFYQCSSPAESVHGPVLLNIQLYLVYIVCLIVLLTVQIRIKFYQLQFMGATFPAEGEEIERIAKSTLASFFTIFSILTLFGIGASSSLVLSHIDPPLIQRFPYYQLALLHQHILLLVITGQPVLSYFMFNARLRENVFRELKSVMVR